MSKLGNIVVFKNTTAINQTVHLNGNWVTVIPGGQIEDYEYGSLARIRGFKVAVGAVPTAVHEANLANKVKGLDVPNVTYPVHLGGGKWELSNGDITSGGIKKEAAQELQAQIDAAEQVAHEASDSAAVDSTSEENW